MARQRWIAHDRDGELVCICVCVCHVVTPGVEKINSSTAPLGPFTSAK